MKKTFAVLLILVLLLTGVCARAETYAIDLLETELTLPKGMTVFRDNSGEESVDLLFSLNGREDVAFETAFTYVEAYEGYCSGDLPKEALAALNKYYTGLISGDMAAFEAVPFFGETGEDGSEINPFLLSGRDENGNAVCLQLMVIDGFVMTVSVVASTQGFDEETMDAYYSLFESVIAMIADETPESVKKGMPFMSAWRERVAALIQSALRSSNGSDNTENGPAVIGASSSTGNGNGSAGDGPILIYNTSGGGNGGSSFDGSCSDGSCSIPWYQDDFDDDYDDDDWYWDDDDYYGYCYPCGGWW